jgi:hypothetical protein
MIPRLRKLYQARLALYRKIATLNDEIATLERTSPAIAGKRIHHNSEGCNWFKPAKETADWSLVDCLGCHKMKMRREQIRPPRRKPKPGQDRGKTIGEKS